MQHAINLIARHIDRALITDNIHAQNPIPKTVIGRLAVSQVLKDLGLSIETGLSKDTVGKDQKDMLVFLRKFRRYFETSEIYQKCEGYFSDFKAKMEVNR